MDYKNTWDLINSFNCASNYKKRIAYKQMSFPQKHSNLFFFLDSIMASLKRELSSFVFFSFLLWSKSQISSLRMEAILLFVFSKLLTTATKFVAGNRRKRACRLCAGTKVVHATAFSIFSSVCIFLSVFKSQKATSEALLE